MKIHFITNSLKLNSGFSIVSRYVAKGLRELGYDITFTGMQTPYLPEYNYGFKTYPVQTQFVDDITQCVLDIQKIKPDIVFCNFQADSEFNGFSKLFPKTMWYTPVEGKNIPVQMANDLKYVIDNGGKVVAQCKYGQSEMAKAGIKAPYIYHGYNPEIFKHFGIKNGKGKNKDTSKDMSYCFYSTDIGKVQSDPLLLHNRGCYDCKLNNKEQLSCPYFKEEIISLLRLIDEKWSQKDINITDLPKETKNKFVFGFIGVNLGVRKRIERLIKAYSIFIDQSRQLKDKTILHLHTHPIAVNGINLIDIINKLGIEDNIIFSYGSHGSAMWTEQAINILYNTFDCNTSASSSEGFGLPTLESMACGIPNIGPNCSSFIELIHENITTDNINIGPRGILAKGYYQLIQDGSYRFLVDEEDLARCMKLIYNREDYENYSKNCLEFVKNYTWEKICLQWDQSLKAMK